MDQEAKDILQMVKDGKVTPEQGAGLLDALKASPSGEPASGGKPRFLRVRVEVNEGGEKKVAVNANLPVALADLGLRIAQAAKITRDGETIVRQGDSGDCMFVVQEGEVEVVREQDGTSVRIATLGAGDFFGEMALLDRERRSASVLALGEARVLTVDKRTFLRRVQEDPSLAFRIVKGMSGRIRKLNAELAKFKTTS